MNISDIITDLDAVRISMYKKYEELGRDHPTWNKKDARLTAFSKRLHILNTVKLSLKFAEDAMKPEWNMRCCLTILIF